MDGKQAIICLTIFFIGSFFVILIKPKIYIAYKEKLLRKQFFNLIVYFATILFPIAATYYLKDFPQKSTYLFATISSFLVFCEYLILIRWTEGKIRDEIETELQDGKDQKMSYTLQIDRLKQKVALEEYIKKLIEAKSKRFLEFLKKQMDGKAEAKHSYIFREITQPDEQVNLMCGLISEYFIRTLIPGGNKGHVSIMIPEDDKLRFAYWAPDRPQSDGSEIFYYGHSAAGKAWESGNIVIIADKQEELNKPEEARIYVKGAKDHKDDIGSLISYPIFDFDKEEKANKRNSLICVINITSTMPNNFVIDDKIHYETILDTIAKRIILESRLKTIKENDSKLNPQSRREGECRITK
jgi:hypothetical protein